MIESNLDSYSQAVFLLEQAVEKYLKALHILKVSLHIPKTHHLDELAEVLNLPDRYPDSYAFTGSSISQIESKEIYNESMQVIAWIEKELKV